MALGGWSREFRVRVLMFPKEPCILICIMCEGISQHARLGVLDWWLGDHFIQRFNQEEESMGAEINPLLSY